MTDPTPDFTNVVERLQTELRREFIRSHPVYMDAVRRVMANHYVEFGISEFWTSVLTGEHDNEDAMILAMDMFSAGLEAGLAATVRFRTKETDQ